MKNTESPKMTSKVLYNLFIKSYEHFNNSEICSKFIAHYHYEERKTLRRITPRYEKNNSPPQKVSKVSQKSSKKLWFQPQKTRNTESPQMTSKVLYGLLIKSCEQIS